MTFQYIPKAGKIYVVTLTSADTWYQVLTAAQANGIRGFKIKARYTAGSAPNAFDYAFESSPDSGDSAGSGYWTNTGVGSGDVAGPKNGLWARSATAGTVIEIMTYL